MNSKRFGRPALALAAAVLTLAVQAAPAAAQLVQNELRSYADVAQVASPAVVNISTDKVVANRNNHPFMNDPFFRRFFEMPEDENHPRGGERVERSLGSGVVISADGYILTNNHVVENADKVKITFEGDREYDAEIVGTDPRTDVALLKIEAAGLPFIRLGDSDALRVGDQVMAIGNPFGVGQTVTMGIVSALGRSIGLIDYEDLIQTDASINPGNSGGALVDMQGRLVGMNSAILSRSGGSQGIGFAIPSRMAMRIVESLKADGEVVRAYLGVLPQEVDQNVANYYGMDRPRGVIVTQVNADTPAAKAGLKEGDIILSVDGTEIRNPSMLRNVISLSEVGSEAKVKLLRDGKEKTLGVTLEKFPEDTRTARANPQGGGTEDESLAGVTVRELSERTRSMGNIPENITGLLVTAVEPTSNAAREGLAAGDVIQEVARRPVTGFGEFQEALGLNDDRPVFLRVYKPRQAQSVFIAVPR
ncbi:MAG: DegQ family serine endoprotease [Krumholzibacteria bacterium]|nr:DegQ family serine endoprotease [Candidatus Krumholzibacteria bacterium]